MAPLLGLGFLSLPCCLASPIQDQVLAYTSIFPNMSCTGHLVIALFLNFLRQSNVLIRRAVARSYWGPLYGDLLESFLLNKLEKTASIQEKFVDLGDP